MEYVIRGVLNEKLSKIYPNLPAAHLKNYEGPGHTSWPKGVIPPTHFNMNAFTAPF